MTGVGAAAPTVLERLARPEACAVPAYNAGLSLEAIRTRYGVTEVTKLASNENPLGPSSRSLQAIHRALGTLGLYPDAGATSLCTAVAATTGVSADRIMVSNGSEQLIEMLCLAFLSPGDRVVTQAPGFGLHEICPQLMGAVVDKVGFDSRMQFDVDAWREALRTPAKLVFIANPSNPVGCACTDAQLAELISAVPEDCVLVLDEAYCEYAQAAGLADGLTLLAARQAPWISLRTFSKAYGLAGLRVGYGIASSAALINLLQRVRQPFPVNTVAQQAAVAALADTAHVAATVLLAAEGRQTVRAALESMGYQVAPSVANFLFFDAGENAAPLAERLLAHGVAVKAWREPGFETWARVTIGSDADNARFLAALAVTRAGRA